MRYFFLILILGFFCGILMPFEEVPSSEFLDSDFAEIDTLSSVASEEMISSPTPPSFALMMVQMIGMLIFLSVLLYLSLFFFKKLNAKYKNKSELTSLKIHENLYFSAKQGLSVISFGKKVYIVGFSNNSVTLIDSIDDEEIITSLTQKTQSQKKFSDLFTSIFTKQNT